jgi:hypothetical protein
VSVLLDSLTEVVPTLTTDEVRGGGGGDGLHSSGVWSLRSLSTSRPIQCWSHGGDVNGSRAWVRTEAMNEKALSSPTSDDVVG